MKLSVYQNALSKFNANTPWPKSLFLSLLFLSIHQFSFGQCNPTGHVSRYEYNLNPTSNINLTGLSFCTDQDMGTNCCGNQGSYRCFDIVINLSNGPNGEMFTPNSNGAFSLTTAQGNFDALFFSVGGPNPGGNGTNCATPIGLGNNYNMMVTLTGNAMGNLEVLLTVADNMGMVVCNTMQVASPGQSIIFSICKPGFGCGEGGEFFFGTCALTGSLAVAPMAPSTLCVGESTTLKIVAGGGVAPYTATVRCITNAGTTYYPVNIPSDGGDPTMDMATFTFTPTGTSNHTCKLVSLVDANGCTEPFNGSGATIFANAVTGGGISVNQVICSNGDPEPFIETFASTGAGTLTYRWESSTTLDCETGFTTIPNASATTYDPLAGLSHSTIYHRVTISTLNGVVCEALSNCVTVKAHSRRQLCRASAYLLTAQTK